MKYTICEIEAFTVIGQEVELTNYQKRNIVPDNFLYKEIQAYKYLVVEYTGSMDKIYETYSKIYKELLPNTEYALLQKDFLHFERYDYRFHWNKES